MPIGNINMNQDQMNALQAGYQKVQGQIAKTGTVNGMTQNQNLATALKQPDGSYISNPNTYQQGVIDRANADTTKLNTPAGGVQNSGGSTNNGGGMSQSSGNAGLINSMYDNNYASQLQKLQEARQIQQQGLNQQETGVNQNALQNLNNNDSMAAQQLKQLQEVQANNGVRGGDSITATIGNQTAQQNGANSINQDRANQLNDIQQKRSLINNNASANDLALMQQLQATRSGQMIDNNNTQDQRALQLGQLMGSYNGQQTLGGQAQSLAAQGQQFNQGITQAGLTGQYGGQQTMQAQNQGFNQGIAQAGLTGQYNGSPTLAASQQAFQDRLNYGQATGTFGNGQKTTQQQQIDMQKDPNSIDNQLKSAQASYYKDHGQYYAGGGSSSGGSSSANKTASTNSFAGSVYDQLSQIDPTDYQGYLEANQGEIVKNIGQKGYDDLKKSVLADQNATDKANTAQGKSDATIRSLAIAAAQKDGRWLDGKTDKNALIKEYEGYHTN